MRTRSLAWRDSSPIATRAFATAAMDIERAIATGIAATGIAAIRML
jgi:hypothetical protein